MISHSWFHAHHPDPSGTQLRELVILLERSGAKSDDLVFYDYCCLYQEDKSHSDFKDDLYKTHPGHPCLRTAQQHELFKEAMGGMRWLCTYGGNTVIIMPDVPLHEANPRPYVDRGWCFFEMCISADYDRVAISSAHTEEMLTRCNLPLDKGSFEEQFSETHFTNNGDRTWVLDCYHRLWREKYLQSIVDRIGDMKVWYLVTVTLFLCWVASLTVV